MRRNGRQGLQAKTMHCASTNGLVALLFAGWVLAGCPSFAQTPSDCLVRIRSAEPTLPKLFESAKSSLQVLMPDPAAYEKTLPPFEKVLASKDVKNLKNYGGLAEAYFYNGEEAKALKIYSLFTANAKQVLGPNDTFPALVGCDIGLLYFSRKNYSKAEPLLLESTKQLEAHLTPANSNNLITDYVCLALINDKAGNKDKAGSYASFLICLNGSVNLRNSKQRTTY